METAAPYYTNELFYLMVEKIVEQCYVGYIITRSVDGYKLEIRRQFKKNDPFAGGGFSPYHKILRKQVTMYGRKAFVWDYYDIKLIMYRLKSYLNLDSVQIHSMIYKGYLEDYNRQVRRKHKI